MITPRRTRLARVPDLPAFRRAISDLVQGSEFEVQRFRALVVVPTRAAGHQLERFVPAADCVTRDELYDRLHARLPNAPRRLTVIERDVLAQAAARELAATGVDLAFQIRPGLVGEMLRFYDQLRRQSQQVTRFEELILDALGPADVDRGADRLRAQTTFLAGAFREYERRVRAVGAVDEHLLRDRLIAEPAPDPVRRIIVTVADWIADSDGLYVADFDLLARLPGLTAIDLVATERVLASGFDERLREWWPGIEEGRVGRVGQVGREGQERQEGPRPVLVTPASRPPDELWWTHRDREEELVAVARRLRAAPQVPLERVAVVFKRPLPYLYLAPKIFGDAGLPCQTSAALPLASEPTAATIDLLLEAVATRFTRGSVVALLRSPHFTFSDGTESVSREAASALDRALSDARYLGDPEMLAALATNWRDKRSAPALRVALHVARELGQLSESRPASEQLRTLIAFWSAHLRPLTDELDRYARERRARAAIEQSLLELAVAHAAEDDPLWTIDELAIAVRRAIEEQTFAAVSCDGGIHLVDDQAVRYGAFDEVAIVGLVESDWPEPPRRNIFYPPGLLKALGWPTEKDRRAAENARFLDLLGCASNRTTVSTLTLDDDALVTPSIQLEEIPRAGLSSVVDDRGSEDRVFLEEALSLDPPVLDVLDDEAQKWAEMRIGRTPADAPAFHGTVSEMGSGVVFPARPQENARLHRSDETTPDPFSVSALETYLECPFKFFAQRVLELEEEPDDEEIMDPRRQGRFVHEVFETFFRQWQAAGHCAITPENLDVARELFAAVVDEALERMPAAEAGLERTRLLGSPAAAGLGEAVLRMEAERPVPVLGRLLEHALRGDFTFTSREGPRTIALAGKVDRLDLLEDGTFRLIDYKLGWPPNRLRALQLPVYGLCAEQQLEPHRGRAWTLGEAVYLAFKGPRRVVPLFTTAADRSKVLADAQQRLVDTVDAIGRGEFPPRPDDVYRCETCRFAAVCRKDYVGDV